MTLYCRYQKMTQFGLASSFHYMHLERNVWTGEFLKKNLLWSWRKLLPLRKVAIHTKLPNSLDDWIDEWLSFQVASTDLHAYLSCGSSELCPSILIECMSPVPTHLKSEIAVICLLTFLILESEWGLCHASWIFVNTWLARTTGVLSAILSASCNSTEAAAARVLLASSLVIGVKDDETEKNKGVLYPTYETGFSHA